MGRGFQEDSQTNQKVGKLSFQHVCKFETNPDSLLNSPNSKESLSVLKAGLLQGSNLAIEQASVPVLMFGMFTVYLAMGGVLTAKTVLTVLLLLMLIQNTIVRYFVKAIFIAVEVSVTISRIKVLNI